ncbi:histidine kinase [Pendulispora rubella]|uniref:Histidine kinase n=1 Tax=Pendulispora rubella TaxID=2741070 RepID=A0ABZ2LK78_9BACT
MQSHSRARSGWIVFAAWTAAGIVSAVETYFYCNEFKGMRVSLAACFVGRVLPWYVWALATPLILRLTAGERTASWPKWRLVLAHTLLFFGTCLAFSLFYPVVDVWMKLAMGGTLTYGQRVLRSLIGWVSAFVFAYGIVLFAGATMSANQRKRESERREAALATELVRAQLSALKSQLQPHFLFNTLNTAVAFVRQGDVKTAERTLLLLSDMLRDVLRQVDSTDVTVREEVQMLKRYLEIQELRFADRLRVTWTIDPQVLEARVPLLLLQPVVENAVRHGIARRASAGMLEIRARREGDQLVLDVRDDGPGPPEGFVLCACPGLGLRNIRERLEQHYGGQAEFRLERVESGGTLASISLPFHTEHDSGTKRVAQPAGPVSAEHVAA